MGGWPGDEVTGPGAELVAGVEVVWGVGAVGLPVRGVRLFVTWLSPRERRCGGVQGERPGKPGAGRAARTTDGRYSDLQA